MRPNNNDQKLEENDKPQQQNGEKFDEKLLTSCKQHLKSMIVYNERKINQTEDKALSDKIKSLYWVGEKQLKLVIDLEDEETSIAMSKAIDILVTLSSYEDPFDMLKILLACKKAAKESIKNPKNKETADQNINICIYVILKANPPRLFSDLQYLFTFANLNIKLCKSKFSHEGMENLKTDDLDSALTDMVSAITMINSYIGDEKNGTLETAYDDNYIKGDCLEEIHKKYANEMRKDFKKLIEQIKEMRKIREDMTKDHKDDMLLIANDLDKHNTNLNIAKASLSLTAIAGGVISIVGFGLMFTTFGASAILIPVGAAIGGAGGIGAGLNCLVEYGIKRDAANKIKEKRSKYETKVIEIVESMDKIETAFASRSEQAQAGVNGSRQIIHFADVVSKLVRVTFISSDAAADGVTSVFRLAGNASRGLAIAGVTFSAVLLPIDMIFFGISIANLARGEKAAQAEEIRQWLDAELPSDELIASVMKKLEEAMIEHSGIVKRRAVNGKEVDLKSCEDKLNNAYEDAKKLIECNNNKEKEGSIRKNDEKKTKV